MQEVCQGRRQVTDTSDKAQSPFRPICDTDRHCHRPCLLGDIGVEVATRLTAFGVHVVGIRRRELEAYPGLSQKDPSLIAGVLYRDFVRRRDDVVVVVARERAR